MTDTLADSRARNDAARTILAIRDRYSEDHDRLATAEPHLMLDEYRWKLAWLIRELNRAAEWEPALPELRRTWLRDRDLTEHDIPEDDS